jgi:hypothetical protein
MSDNNSVRRSCFLVLVIAMLAVVAYILLSSQVNQVFQPLRDLGEGFGTEVAQVIHPTPTVLPDPLTVIKEVRSIARLETIEYTVEKVITAETGQGSFSFLTGEKLLFVAHGTVIAGVDLTKMASEDLWVSENVLYVRMPYPEVFIATLDNDKSYVYDYQSALIKRLLGTTDFTLETTARRAAEDEIQKAALEDGILDQAQQNAQDYLVRLLRNLGYIEIVFVQPGGQPAPTLPPIATSTPAATTQP